MDFSNPRTTNALVIAVGAVIVIGILGSYSKSGTSSTPSPASSNSTAELIQLKNQVVELKATIDEQARSIRLLKFTQQQLKRRNATATFDTTSEGFQQVDSDISPFLISIHDVKPYGDGTRLTIRIGNVAAADFSGVSLNLQYGRKAPESEDGSLDFEELAKPYYATKDKEHKVLERIKASSWNPTTVTLPGVKPDELGYITIAIQASQVFLSAN